jgi:hypothetical protein
VLCLFVCYDWLPWCLKHLKAPSSCFPNVVREGKLAPSTQSTAPSPFNYPPHFPTFLEDIGTIRSLIVSSALVLLFPHIERSSGLKAPLAQHLQYGDSFAHQIHGVAPSTWQPLTNPQLSETLLIVRYS